MIYGIYSNKEYIYMFCLSFQTISKMVKMNGCVVVYKYIGSIYILRVLY